MRELIFVLYLMAAIGVSCLTVIGVVVSRSVHDALVVLIGLGWIVCAVRLKVSGLWAWVGSLLATSAIVAGMGAQTLRYTALIARAQAGDTSLELDPSTIGMTLLCSGMLTIGALGLLVALFSFPWLRGEPNRTLRGTPGLRVGSISKSGPAPLR
jgi:hypothetical protein